MSDQMIIWGLLTVTWLTLFFMKKKDIKRYIPVALFATITSAVIVEVGNALKWWGISETGHPFQNLSYLYAIIPVLTMWIFNFFYKNFKLYIAANVLFNTGLTYLFLDYFLSSRGIYPYIGVTPFQAFQILSIQGIILYSFQAWHESVFARSENKMTSMNLQPAAAKPLPQDQKDNPDSQS